MRVGPAHIEYWGGGARTTMRVGSAHPYPLPAMWKTRRGMRGSKAHITPASRTFPFWLPR
jgi:hypothetical protein